MGVVGRLGKILGPRGLMPNPRLGTVTMDVKGAVTAAKGGQVEFRAEKAGIIHAGIGKASFDEDKLVENARALADAIQKAKPTGAKGTYVQKASLSSHDGAGHPGRRQLSSARLNEIRRRRPSGARRAGRVRDACPRTCPRPHVSALSGMLMDLRVRGWETGCQRIARGSPGTGVWWFRLECRSRDGAGQANRTGGSTALGSMGNQAPARSKRAWHQNGDDTWTVRKSGNSSPASHQALPTPRWSWSTHNAGLTVAEATDLRRRMRAAGVDLQGREKPAGPPRPGRDPIRRPHAMLKGPTALAWSTDPVAVAKTAVEFAKTNEKFVVIGGSLGTRTLDADGVKALADLPSLDTLRAGLLGMISTPATRDRRHPPGAGGTTRSGLRGLRQEG